MTADRPARDSRGDHGAGLDNPYAAGGASAHRHPDPRRLLLTAGALTVGVAGGLGVLPVLGDAPVHAAAVGSEDATRIGTASGVLGAAVAAVDARAVAAQVDERLAGVESDHARRCATTQAIAAGQAPVPVTRVPAGAATADAVASLRAWLDAPATPPDQGEPAEPVELRGAWSWGGRADTASVVRAETATVDATWQSFRAELCGFTEAVARTAAPSRGGGEDPAWARGSWQDAHGGSGAVGTWAHRWSHDSIDRMVGRSLAPEHARIRSTVAPQEVG